jgi:hypothetical protein
MGLTALVAWILGDPALRARNLQDMCLLACTLATLPPIDSGMATSLSGLERRISELTFFLVSMRSFLWLHNMSWTGVSVALIINSWVLVHFHATSACSIRLPMVWWRASRTHL